LISTGIAPLPSTYAHLCRFVDYIGASRTINPLTLVREERRLSRAIEDRCASDRSERDVVFMADFIRLLDDYAGSSISAEDYAWFQRDFRRFASLWEQYVGSDDLAALTPFRADLDDYYRVNLERNSWFVKNTLDPGFCNLKDQAITEAVPGGQGADELKRVVASLPRAAKVVVAVTGGFHTSGYTDRLKELKISYLVITPNITHDTGSAGRLYRALIELQGKFLSQAPVRCYANTLTFAEPILTGFKARGAPRTLCGTLAPQQHRGEHSMLPYRAGRRGGCRRSKGDLQMSRYLCASTLDRISFFKSPDDLRLAQFAAAATSGLLKESRGAPREVEMKVNELLADQQLRWGAARPDAFRLLEINDGTFRFEIRSDGKTAEFVGDISRDEPLVKKEEKAPALERAGFLRRSVAGFVAIFHRRAGRKRGGAVSTHSGRFYGSNSAGGKSKSFEALKLRGERQRFTLADAAQERQTEKNWQPVAGVGGVPGDMFEMPVKDRQELERVLGQGSDGGIGALLAKAVAALTEGLRTRLNGRTIRVSLINENVSQHLFEDPENNNYIGINRTFLEIASALNKINPKIAPVFFVAGVAHELYHEAGVADEDVQRDARHLVELLSANGVKNEFERVIGTLNRYIAEAGLAEAVADILAAQRVKEEHASPLADTSAEYALQVLPSAGMPGDNVLSMACELPAGYDERIEQTARMLLPYSPRLLSAVNILLYHQKSRDIRKLSVALFAPEDGAKVEGETLHLSFADPAGMDTAQALRLFRKELGWDIADAVFRVASGNRRLRTATCR